MTRWPLAVRPCGDATGGPQPPAAGTVPEWVAWGIALLGGTIAAALQTVSRLTPRLKRAEELARQAVHELRPNSGSSMRDSADRTEAAVTQLFVEVRALQDDLRDLRQASRRHDGELGRLADATEQIRDRITRAEDREAQHLAALDARVHTLETARGEYRDNP